MQSEFREGRKFESEVLGITHTKSELEQYKTFPDYLDLDRSIQQQIVRNWQKLEHAYQVGGNGHNPYEPIHGRTFDLWRVVSNSLLDIGEEPEVLLYLAVGKNSLDFHHGVDFFFWWKGVYVTVDLTTKPNKRQKADFLFLPEDLEPSGLAQFGDRVAYLLWNRYFNLPPPEVDSNGNLW